MGRSRHLRTTAITRIPVTPQNAQVLRIHTVMPSATMVHIPVVGNGALENRIGETMGPHRAPPEPELTITVGIVVPTPDPAPPLLPDLGKKPP
jgi:hypothetical protein